MPDWLWAYDYPHNVNMEGIPIPGCDWGDYCYHLPMMVYRLYRKICLDSRHTEPVILMYQEILHRQFDDWYMGHIPSINISGGTVLKYSKERHFNPYTMTPEAALKFLLELSQINAVL